MSSEISGKYLVAVIGAGPAGLFAARQLALKNVHVVLINRDIKPGGLAEYGIYYDKYKMKEGLRRQFRQILESPQIEYYGNLSIGQKADLTLPELRAIGFQALLVNEVLAIAMSPGRRHITKPVCEITFALREANILTSTLVLNAGAGILRMHPQPEEEASWALRPRRKNKSKGLKW